MTCYKGDISLGSLLRCLCMSMYVCMCLVAQSCPTLWDPIDCSPPGSFVHWILQSRILEWVAISFSRGSFLPRDWIQVSCIAGRFSIIWATKESLLVSIPPLYGREGNGSLLQYSCLGNLTDGEAWWTPVYGITDRHKWAHTHLYMDYHLE